MSRTMIENDNASPLPLPLPYTGVIAPGGAGIVADTVANVVSAFGGVNAVNAMQIRLSIRPDTDTVTNATVSNPPLTVPSADTLVGNGSNVGTAVPLSGDVTMDNTGAVTIGAKKVGAAKIALTDGTVLVGAVGGAAAEQTLSGDVTMTDAGVTAIGANKVTSAKTDPALIQTVVLDLTNAQIKALRGTPKTLVAAPGVGKVIVPIDVSVYLKYAGTNAFTANAGENLSVYRTGGSSLFSGGVQAFLQATASGVNKMFPAVVATPSEYDSKANSDNAALLIANIGAVEIAGNAGADNLIRVVCTYRIDAAPTSW